MSAAAEVVTQAREYHLGKQEFAFLCAVVKQHTGINLSEAKRELVYSRLSKRLRQLRLKDFREYCALLEEGDEAELLCMVNAVTTNLTGFFRENHHFDYLRNNLLPELLRSNAARRQLRIWSAGCSTGQEPYSIAMVLAEALGGDSKWDARILATDLDTDVLEVGRSGIYPQDRVEKVPRDRLRRWFRRGRRLHAGKVRVLPELQRLVLFKRLNLMESWPMRGPFDAIFCRNVLIYFDKPTQRRLVDRFADLLPVDGHLFLGHSESLHNVSSRFKLVGTTIYRKMT